MTKGPHQKSYAISDMSAEERHNLADPLEAELKALDEDIDAGNVQDIDPAMLERMKALTADIEVDLDEPIEGDVVISGSGNVFADLGLNNAEELKSACEQMIREGVPAEEAIATLRAIEAGPAKGSD
jgi:hypothetical protein